MSYATKNGAKATTKKANTLSISLSGDSAGIRTQNLRLRRALLYPVELPNQNFCGCKDRII